MKPFLLLPLAALLTAPIAFSNQSESVYIGSHSHIDSTFKLIEVDGAFQTATTHEFKAAPNAFNTTVVAGPAGGAAEHVFGLAKRGPVYVGAIPAAGATGLFIESAQNSFLTIAPYSRNGVLAVVTGTNELRIVWSDGRSAAVWSPRTFVVSASTYGEIFKMKRISTDRYVMITDKWLFVVNLANSNAPIEYKYEFTDAASAKSSLKGRVASLWDVVADGTRAWVNVEIIDSANRATHVATLVSFAKGPQSSLQLASGYVTTFDSIDPVTGDFSGKWGNSYVKYEVSGNAQTIDRDIFDAQRLSARFGIKPGMNPFLSIAATSMAVSAAITSHAGAAQPQVSARKTVLDPIEPHEFRKFIEIEQSHDKMLLRDSILRDIVTTAAKLAAWVNQTTTLKYFFRNVRDELAPMGLRFQVDSLMVLNGAGATPISVGELLVLLSKGAKAERDMKNCETLVKKR